MQGVRALQRLRGEPDAALTALDAAGHCVVADATARSILALWQEIVAARELAQPSVVPAAVRKPHQGRSRRLLRSQFRRSPHRRRRALALADRNTHRRSMAREAACAGPNALRVGRPFTVKEPPVSKRPRWALMQVNSLVQSWAESPAVLLGGQGQRIAKSKYGR
jgi:hypothetical protein